MKISNILKVLGAAAAVASLTPYKVEKDEESGVTTMKALLWSARHTPATEDAGRNIDVTLGLNIPGRKDGEDFGGGAEDPDFEDPVPDGEFEPDGDAEALEDPDALKDPIDVPDGKTQAAPEELEDGGTAPVPED